MPVSPRFISLANRRIVWKLTNFSSVALSMNLRDGGPGKMSRLEVQEDVKGDLRAVYWVGFGNSWGYWHNNFVLQQLCS